MERLVIELENFNFRQDNKNEQRENRVSSFFRNTLTERLPFTFNDYLSAGLTNMNIPVLGKPLATCTGTDDSEDSTIDENPDTSTDDNEDYVDNVEGNHFNDGARKAPYSSSHSGGRYKSLRNRSERVSKESFLHSRNLRTPMKPAKPNAKSTGALTHAEITKIYTNKKLTKFRPTSLETIFEEPQPIRGTSKDRPNEQFRLIGAKKFKRALICSDGLNTNKTLIKQRRAKIKKNFGRRATFKKMPLQNFLHYMHQSLNDTTTDDESTNPQMENIKTNKSLDNIEEEEMEMEVINAPKTEDIPKTDGDCIDVANAAIISNTIHIMPQVKGI